MRELPRIGCLGAGWIGRNRMSGLAASGAAHVVAVADTSPEAGAAAAAAAGVALTLRSLDDLLDLDLDGLVIATPNAGHAPQALAALQRRLAVFCQKPLGLHAGETADVVEAARRADRLLGVDFSYRFTSGLQKIHQLVASGTLGELYAAELTFHNAYGPDKAWFYDRRLSGGGCAIDLGVHLIDLALWMFDARVIGVSSRLFAGGSTWHPGREGVEDFVSIRLDFETGATANIACSWRAAVGRDAAIEATFYGTRGAARWQNVNGSFFDFVTERLDGRTSRTLDTPPDDWGPRAIVSWARALGNGTGFDAQISRAVEVARILDRAYQLESIDVGARGYDLNPP